MTFKTERAKSNKGRCKNCKDIIKKDEIKLVEEYKGQFYPIKNSYCKDCGKIVIRNLILELSERLRELK